MDRVRAGLSISLPSIKMDFVNVDIDNIIDRVRSACQTNLVLKILLNVCGRLLGSGLD